MTFYNIFSKKEKSDKKEKQSNISEIIIDTREKQSLVPSNLLEKKSDYFSI